MKILVCGDKHLKITRFDRSKQLLEWLNEKIDELKPDLVVALGDDMDTHAVLRSELMYEFRKHIDFVVKRCDMVYLVGNHDYFKPNDTTYHAMQSFKGLYDNFHIVDGHSVLYSMDFVHHVHNHKDFPDVKQEICFAHQTFVGADYGFYRPDIGVDADKLKSSIIISGHVHRRQEFGKVIYPGSPYAHSVNHIDQDKGIMLFDTNTYEKTFIRSPFPMWRSVKYDVVGNNNIEILHSLLGETLNIKDNWVLQLSGPKTELTAYLNSKEYIKLTKKKNVLTKLTFTDKAKKNIAINSFSIKDIVNEYVSKAYDGTIKKEDVIKKAIHIIDTVNSRD